MSAIGSSTGNTYNEDEILKSPRFELMKEEVLHAPNEPETIVVPVRNKFKPHFRILSKAPQAKRVGSGESNPTHTKVIDFLLRSLRKRPQLQVMTLVFEEDRIEQQTICKVPARKTQKGYTWWSEARIRIDQNRYIQPDICGRSERDFLPLRDEPGVVIEVIQTHYPDEHTFGQLVALSERNFIVLFYFVAEDGWGSKFSSVELKEDGIVKIRSAYWLADGALFRNGELVKRAEMDDSKWYLHVKTRYFDAVMTAKEKENKNPLAT